MRGALISSVLIAASAAAIGVAAAQPAASPEQLVTSQDIARACQRTHRNPQAQAEPTTVGPYGIQLNCRLINAAGFTLARVSPEEVCEPITGRRDWRRGEGTAVYCIGAPLAGAATGPGPNPNPNPNPAPGPGPGPGGGPGGGAGGAGAGAGGAGAGGGVAGGTGDVPLTPERVAEACGKLAGGTGAGQVRWGHWYEPAIVCGGRTVTPEQICPHVTGGTAWYVGEQTPPAGPMAVSFPNVTCRGSGPRQFIALAHIYRYCKARGYEAGNTGLSSNRMPVCAHLRQPPAISFQPADICREQYGTGAVEARGLLHWCRP